MPKTVSVEAQRFLAAGIPRADKTVWTEDTIAMTNRYLMNRCSAFAELFPADIVQHQLATAPLYEITARVSQINEHRAILYLHGGAFLYGGGLLAAMTALPIAARAHCKVYASDYRMPPKHPFPAALDDALDAYRYLLDRFKPQNIAVYGGSAGGGLAAALILKARDMGLPLPGAAVLVTPEADLTESGDTFETNQLIDVVLQQRLTDSIALYANGHDLKDPYLSPIFADFNSGFPPTQLISGTRDLFLSNTVILHRALLRAGIKAELHVFEAMPHGGFHGAPEDNESLVEQLRFIDEHLEK
ncbi:MAG TPA: alpha/beta hydrolase fold domain-containing protein [Spongiibacteraceae bacterium]